MGTPVDPLACLRIRAFAGAAQQLIRSRGGKQENVAADFAMQPQNAPVYTWPNERGGGWNSSTAGCLGGSGWPGITLFAGFVKGAVGFAMPLIMIAVFSSFMPPDLALAALILSVLSTNLHQSMRFGWAAARASALKYWRMILMTCLGIVISAPFVVWLPQSVMLGCWACR
jgi:hypothetical protein